MLVLQPVRIPTYIAVFFLGTWAWKAGWFTHEGYTPVCLPWCVTFLITGLLYLWQKLFPVMVPASPAILVWINAFCQSAFTVSALFALLALFHRHFNHSTRITSALSETSYGVYYLHQPILFPLVWLFVAFPLSSPVKLLLVSLITLMICFLLSRHILNTVPVLRDCFRS